MTVSADNNAFQPRATCAVSCVAGWSFCRRKDCGWTDHPGSNDPCLAALEDAQDAAIREAIESGTDWRPKERLLNGGPGMKPKRKGKD